MKRLFTVLLAALMLTACEVKEPASTGNPNLTVQNNQEMSITQNTDSKPEPTVPVVYKMWFVETYGMPKEQKDLYLEEIQDASRIRETMTNLTLKYHAQADLERSAVFGFNYSDGNELGEESAASILDDNPHTKFCSGNGNIEQHYLIWNMDEPVTVKAYIYTTANDNATYTERNMESWALLGTNEELPKDYTLIEGVEGSTTRDYTEFWNVIDVVNYAVIPDENYYECGFTVDPENQAAYKTYMLYFNWGEEGTNCLQIGDFTIFG